MLLLLFSGCSRTVSRQELLTYTFDPDHGLYQKLEKDDALIEVIYRPSDLILYQQLKGESRSAAQIDSMKNYYRSLDYFLIRLSRNGKEINIPYAGNPSRFNQVNDYLNFNIGKDVSLVHDKDIIPVLDFIHTRTFGSSPSSDILFAFKSGLTNKSGEVKVLFDDHAFGLGLNQFTFNCNDIKSAPHIDFNQ